MTDRGIASWTDGLTARERVRAIATTLTEPHSVEWIREEAGVSAWQTTKDELEMLVEFDQVRTVEGDDGNVRYAPHYQRRYVGEVTALVEDHSREELREQVAAIQDGIDEWKETFDVESRSDLEATLTDDDLAGPEVRRRNAVLREWERRADDRRLLRHALELYDDARTIRSGADDEADSSPARS